MLALAASLYDADKAKVYTGSALGEEARSDYGTDKIRPPFCILGPLSKDVVRIAEIKQTFIDSGKRTSWQTVGF